MFQKCLLDPISTGMATVLGSTWSVLLLRVVMQDAAGGIFHMHLELRILVFVDDMPLHLRGASVDVPERMKEFSPCHKAQMKTSRFHLLLRKTRKVRAGFRFQWFYKEKGWV